MKDVLGNELNIGDKVITLAPKYRELVVGDIIRFTKCLAVVNHKGDELKQASFQLVKVNQCQQCSSQVPVP